MHGDLQERSVKGLNMMVLSSIYGCIEAAMLWYKLYTKELVKMGFTLNPYDKCMSNKMINVKKCTITWHVDDNNISHVNVDIVKEVMEVLQKFFGKFTVTRGRSYSYLDMNIELREDRKACVDMIEEIEKIIEDFSEKINGKVTSPATKYMHNTTCNSKLLEGKIHDKLH